MASTKNTLLIPFLLLTLFLLFQLNISIRLCIGEECTSNNDCCRDWFCRFPSPSNIGTCIKKSTCIEKNYYYCDNKDNKCCKGLNCKTDYIGRSFCRPYNCAKENGACNIDNNQCCYGFQCLDKKCVKCNSIENHLCLY